MKWEWGTLIGEKAGILKKEPSKALENLDRVLSRSVFHTIAWSWDFQSDKVFLGDHSQIVISGEQFSSIFRSPLHASLKDYIQSNSRALLPIDIEIQYLSSPSLWVKMIGSGKSKSSRGQLINITKNKYLEFQLREVEGRFRALTNTLPAMVWMTNEEGSYTYFSQSWLEFVGVGFYEKFSQNWLDYIHPEDQKMYRYDLEQKIFNKEKLNAQFRLLRSDGEYRWVLYTGIPRLTGESNRHGYMGSILDISDRLNSDTVRRRNHQIEQRLQTLMKIVPVGIFQTDEAGSFVYVNEKWTIMTGVTLENSLKDGWLMAIHPSDREEVIEKWRAGIKASLEFDFDCRILTFSSRTVWVSWRTSVLHDSSGRPVGFTGTVHDITDRKELENTLIVAREEAVKGSELKSSFLATMSHEIRTPLNAVIGMTGLLQKTKLDEEQADFVETIKVSGESLLSLINDTLDLSKVEANKLELERTIFNLHEWTRDSVEAFCYSGHSKGLAYHVEIEVENSIYVQGDPARIRQIINNLLSNAVKFTEEGFIKIKTTANLNEKEVKFFFEVVDSGIGISESAKKNLFQPFSQADASTTRKYGGTGLGLSICKGLVEMMSGEIGFESEQKKGSRFWFSIPLLFAKNEVKQISSDEWRDTPSQRVLVVDDNPINQKVAVKMLQKLGHYADSVATGLEALKSVEKIPYDLILMDCQMPEMDGYEATRRIRRHSQMQLRNIPIVAMTANAIKGDKEKCLQCGMDDYVSKPLDLETLRSAINNNFLRQGGLDDSSRNNSKFSFIGTQ